MSIKLCWQLKSMQGTNELVRANTTMSYAQAEAWAEELNRIFPHLKHWVEKTN